MYTIKAYVDGEEYTIHDSRVKALTVGGKPYFEVGDNINGSASFSVYPNHPYYDKVKKLTTDIIFYRDDEPEFYGRVLYDDEDFSGISAISAPSISPSMLALSIPQSHRFIRIPIASF